MNLEGDASKVEGAVPTSKEGVEPTPLKVEPTVRTYSQAELDTAVGKGLSSVNTQLSVHKAAAETAKAEVDAAKASVQTIEVELQSLQRQYDELVTKQFADDPEARQAYIDKRAIAEERKKLATEIATTKKEKEVAAKDLMAALLSRKADALVRETGIELSELENCQTEEAMEIKALRFKLTREPEVKEPEKAPKFDSGLGGGSGEDLSSLTPIERAGKELAIAKARQVKRRSGQSSDPDYKP